MWLFLSFGFFSIVQKPGTDFLTVRTRVRKDLEQLRKDYLPQLSELEKNAGTDYQWRAKVSHQAFSEALGRIAAEIHYPNFKNEVAVCSGKPRAQLYGKVWQAVAALADSE